MSPDVKIWLILIPEGELQQNVRNWTTPLFLQCRTRNHRGQGPSLNLLGKKKKKFIIEGTHVNFIPPHSG